MIAEVHITLCDILNPGFGYQLRIVDTTGRSLLFTDRDPATGSNLSTYADALRVATMYAATPAPPAPTPETLTCDMENDCTAPVTHVDEKGWLYCATHGPQRRQSGRQCRKLTAAEIKRLQAGLTISYERKDAHR